MASNDNDFFTDLLQDPTHAQLNDSTHFVELVKLLPHYQLTIPEAVIRHHLQKVGCQPVDNVVTKLIALAAQKFAWEVLEGALAFERTQNATNPEETPLTTETLVMSLREHNVDGLDAVALRDPVPR
jgi:hypothetical protein|tara:strand:- start:978 stop:1358 length:381 start_codon:yes stop_codon:yes gene_type:complete